jgi:uncharacterized RDD family membrane protein YckC
VTASSVPAPVDVTLQGHYAGFVTRLVAFVIDVVVVTTLFALAGRVLEYVVSALTGNMFNLSDHPVVADVALVVWAFIYSSYCLGHGGRTPGMAVLGLRAVRRDGAPLDGWHAVLRTLVFPLSFAVFCIGFIIIPIGRERRALHDLIASTAVVYSWDASSARLRFLARQKT